LEGQYQRSFKYGAKASPSSIANQKSLHQQNRLDEGYMIQKYQQHLKGYFNKPVDTNPYSIRLKYDPDETTNQYTQLLHNSARYAAGGKKKKLSLGFGGIPNRKTYPTRLEVDKYYDLISTIEVQKGKLVGTVTTHQDRL